jgi:DNA-binding MarR family transcriptional regulator
LQLNIDAEFPAMITRANRAVAEKRRSHRARKVRYAPQGVEHIAAYLLGVDDIFKKKLGMSALRPAARLLLFLAVRQSVTIKEAMQDSTLSYRAFYVMLDNLKEEVLVQVEKDDHDLRIRRLVLDASFDSIAKLMCEADALSAFVKLC